MLLAEVTPLKRPAAYAEALFTISLISQDNRSGEPQRDDPDRGRHLAV